MTDAASIATQNSSLSLVAGGEPPPFTERLVRALEAHRAASAADIATCRQVARSMADDPTVELLIGMIVQDEERHDSLLLSMIGHLQEGADVAARVPNGSGRGTAEAAEETAANVRGLMRNEHEGARHLRHLARQEPTLYGGLYPVLLETIARDSEKHATILRYLLHRVEGQAR